MGDVRVEGHCYWLFLCYIALINDVNVEDDKNDSSEGASGGICAQRKETLNSPPFYFSLLLRLCCSTPLTSICLHHLYPIITVHKHRTHRHGLDHRNATANARGAGAI